MTSNSHQEAYNNIDLFDLGFKLVGRRIQYQEETKTIKRVGINNHEIEFEDGTTTQLEELPLEELQ